MTKELGCTQFKPVNQSARPPKAQIEFEDSLLWPCSATIKMGSQSDDGLSADTAFKMTAELHF